MCGNLSVTLRVTSNGAIFLYDMHTVNKVSWTTRCDYHWTKPFVNQTNHRIWIDANSYINNNARHEWVFFFPSARTINIYIRVLEYWISSDYRWRETGCIILCEYVRLNRADTLRHVTIIIVQELHRYVILRVD